jgi:hypothetical protein
MKSLNNDPFISFAKIISIIFQPLFMPFYGMAIILFSGTSLGFLPVNLKRLLLLIVLVNNILLPVSLLPFFKQMNFISSWTIDDRRDRILPLITATILYGITSYLLYRFPLPLFIKSFVFSTFLLSFLTTLLNLTVKISLHSIGIGALISLLLQLIFVLHAPLFWYLIFSFIAAGMVISSRLRLNLHSPLEVWSGFLTGLVGLTLLMLIF